MEEKKKNKKKKLWSVLDEEFHLELWEEKEAELRGCRKNGHIYKEMSAAFEGRLVVYTVEEIKMKIHNLTNRYKKEKKLIGPSGGSPSEWPLYSRIHAILGEHRVFNLDEIVEDSRPQSMLSNSISSIDGAGESRYSTASYSEFEDEPMIAESIAPSTSRSAARAKKRKIKENENSLIQSDERFEKFFKQINASDKEAKERDEKKIALFEKFLLMTEELNKNILQKIQNINK